MTAWRKEGLIWAPKGDKWWARQYATVPTADVIDDNVIRVYFASLDDDQFGRIGYVELDANNPGRVLFESPEPILDIGPRGTFDDCGVNPSCIVNVGRQKYLYYIGWQRCERVPYMLFAGLAVSDDDVTFERVSSAPILDRNPEEPLLRSATTILREEGCFRCWYVSATDWISAQGKDYPTYVIRHVSSQDGLEWSSRSDICIALNGEDEFGLGRPWVIRERDLYKMWYSIRSRSQPYRIGYAESSDGITWTRKDESAGIERSSQGWDSEMICYPCVVNTASRRYMFHNGNRHGASGFGYAIQQG